MSPPPRGGQYSLSIISLSLKLVLEAGSSLRGAAAAMAQFVEHTFASFDVPSFSAIRSWLLRVGQYALTRPLDRSTPWLWLVDHTIQIGVQKILVILGCPMDQVPFGQRALQLSDLQLVALVPMEKSNAGLVEAELEQAVERTGRTRLIVSDQGSDLKKGIADFQGWYPRTAYVPDVAHYGATQLEHAWDDQPRWQQFIKELQSTSAKLRQTKSAYLLAPRMRPKARFMNVHVQLRFARRVMKLLQREVPHPKATEYYGWLKDYQEDLAVWEREHALVRTATVIDYYSRYLLACRLTNSYSAIEVSHALAEARQEAERLHGPLSKPPFLVTDNGPSFLARRFGDFIKGSYQHVRIRYRTPQQLGLLERFHQTLKTEEVYWRIYTDPMHARSCLADFRARYNYFRPHWALRPEEGGDPLVSACSCSGK